jgi:hypothetical protein
MQIIRHGQGGDYALLDVNFGALSLGFCHNKNLRKRLPDLPGMLGFTSGTQITRIWISRIGDEAAH